MRPRYALPALPATALLGARAWQRLRAGDGAWAAIGVLAGALVVAGAAGVVGGPRLVSQVYWIRQVPPLARLAVPAGAALVASGLLLALAWAWRRALFVPLALAAGALSLAAVLVRAELEVEPLFSWRPLAQALASAVPPGTEIVFEAPEEYQLVGGLAYYTRRRITMIDAPGFVPPPYLAGHMGETFASRADVEQRWRSSAPVAFVSDPQRRRESPAGLVPEPFRVIGRFGDRWVLANPAAHPG